MSLSHHRLATIALLLSLLALPNISLAGAIDCTPFETDWDANAPYVMSEATETNRYIELDNGITCANSYTGNTPTVQLNGDITVSDDILFQPQPGTNGDNAFTIISNDLVIDGAQNTIRRDNTNATPDYRLFQVNSGSNVTIQDATLTGGALNTGGTAGGAIHNEGTLTLDDVTLSSSTAERGGGLYASNGTTRLINTTVSGNFTVVGGAAYVDDSATLTVLSSTVTGNGSLTGSNLAANGGGIANDGGTVNVANSLLADNSTNGNGGALANLTGNMTVVSSTLADNTADGSGDAIYNQAQLTLDNSILGNRAVTADRASLTSQRNGSGNLLINTNNVTTNSKSIIADTSFIGDDIINTDPSLDASYTPLSDSPAIDNGDPTQLPTDSNDLDNDGNTAERLPVDIDGAPRTQQTNLDIGAQETNFAFELIEGGITPTDAIFVVNRVGKDANKGRNAAADRNTDTVINATDVSLIIGQIGTPAP